MIIVIQCAGSKKFGASTLQTKRGQPVRFVAHPELAPGSREIFAKPDDRSDDGTTWRDLLLEVNRGSSPSSPGLLTAGNLYRPSAYQQLLKHVGYEKLYILSAGWGLVRSDFLLPDYDITFSGQADAYKRRRMSDSYSDFSMLPSNSDEPILFFGGKDYLPLFRKLSANYLGTRFVLYKSAQRPNCPECATVHFVTSRSTNWHYEAVENFIGGNLHLPNR